MQKRPRKQFLRKKDLLQRNEKRLRRAIRLKGEQYGSTATYAELVQRKVIDPGAVRLVPQSLVAPHIGRAVVACRNFEKTDVLCSYGGDIIDAQQFAQLFQQYAPKDARVSYLVSADKYWTVDGWPELESAQGHLGIFINDARNIKGARVNCAINLVYDVVAQRICHIIIEAIRPIKSGEELWLDYGTDYWKS